MRTPLTMFASLFWAMKRAVCEKPQSGVTCTRSGSICLSVRRRRSATRSGGSIQVFFTSTKPTASSMGGLISPARSISAISRLANSRAGCSLNAARGGIGSGTGHFGGGIGASAQATIFLAEAEAARRRQPVDAHVAAALIVGRRAPLPRLRQRTQSGQIVVEAEVEVDAL